MDIEELPKVTGAPEVIWLNYGEIEKTESHRDILNNGDVLWCEDQVNGSDVKYIRADAIVAKLEAARRLRDALKILHDENMDYIKLNNLGAENNQSLRMAREALAAFDKEQQ